ncbi:MAG: TonB-dependent receptor plug domain-containing protein [Lentisphaerales bacterium]|nr:TonB-dependent receptor plug domain-containing protein [Lentisphaerales bacterium]
MSLSKTTKRYFQKASLFSLLFFSLQINTLAEEALLNLSLEELMNVKISHTATLTDTEKRKIPASLTRITSEDIENANARSLDELLRIYVPGVQSMIKNSGGDQLGIRGIISDRNNKFLILVNGRVMNEKTVWGGITERDLSILGDIQYVDVIRGPGSVTYGPGALAGVINIVTHTGKTFNGMDIQVKQGFIEEFNNLEIRLGHTFKDDSKLFAYYGIDNYSGADGDDAPHIFGHSFTSPQGESTAGKPFPKDFINDDRAYRNRVRHKAHIHYTIEDLQLHVRYTRGGKYSSYNRTSLSSSNESRAEKTSHGYQQLTLGADYKQEISDDFWFDYRFSFDMLDTEMEKGQNETSNYREDEYYARIMANWQPVENHKLAFGTDYSHDQFGKDSPGYPNIDPRIERLGNNPGQWSSDTLSLLAEHQWNINEQFTTFTGLRLDLNNYTSDLWSGRTALVYTPTAKDTVKLIYNHSVRKMDEAELRASEWAGTDTGESEQLDNYELRYERQHTNEVWFALSTFYVDYDVIAWTNSLKETRPLGNLEYGGLELEWIYQTDKFKVSLAHSYIQHLNFNSIEEGQVNNVTASDLGYGDDLANWYNHQTTMSAYYKLNEKWKITSSLTALWRLPGGHDLAEYNNDNGNQNNLPKHDSDFNRSWDESIHLNMGLEYKQTEQLTLRLDAYNMMG